MTSQTKPFIFLTSVPLVELTGQRAKNLKELAELIEQGDDASIFFHTHHYVREHHFLSQEYPSDFAYWVAEILQEKALGERLANLDVRNFSTVAALREEIATIFQSHLEGKSYYRDVAPGLEFHFRRVINIVTATGDTAATLEEFRHCLQVVDNNSLYYHLVESRLRNQRPGNDFSNWFLECQNKQGLAQQIERINPYVHTLDQTRQRILDLLDRELARERVVAKIAGYPQTTGIGRVVREHKLIKQIRSFLERKELKK